LAGRYDNPIPPWFLPPIDFLKIPALYILTVYGCGGDGEVLNCSVDHILREIYTLFVTRFGTYKIDSPPQTKMTSKDDIKGLVSLKFLRPWFHDMEQLEDERAYKQMAEGKR
jgi:hypothetical protein